MPLFRGGSEHENRFTMGSSFGRVTDWFEEKERKRERERQDETRKGGNSRLEGNPRWNGSPLWFYMGPLRGFIARAVHASDVGEGTKEEKEREERVLRST